jgi:hypothetical protein
MGHDSRGLQSEIPRFIRHFSPNATGSLGEISHFALES